MDEQNPRIKRHSSRGGISAVYENGYITIYRVNENESSSSSECTIDKAEGKHHL